MSPSAVSAHLAHLILPSAHGSSTAANGSGWSTTYDGVLYSDSIDSFSQFLHQHLPSPPSIETIPPGFLVGLQTFQNLAPTYLEDIYAYDSTCKIRHFPSAYFSSLHYVTRFVDNTLAQYGIPATGRDSLVSLLLSFGQRHEETSIRWLVPFYLDFNMTTVLRNEDEAEDWLHGGTAESVIVKTLKATYASIHVLKKRSFGGWRSRGESCRVCLDGLKDRRRVCRLGCSHEFHHGCIEEWFKSNNQCPFCRFAMPWVHWLIPGNLCSDFPTSD